MPNYHKRNAAKSHVVFENNHPQPINRRPFSAIPVPLTSSTVLYDKTIAIEQQEEQFDADFSDFDHVTLRSSFSTIRAGNGREGDSHERNLLDNNSRILSEIGEENENELGNFMADGHYRHQTPPLHKDFPIDPNQRNIRNLSILADNDYHYSDNEWKIDWQRLLKYILGALFFIVVLVAIIFGIISIFSSGNANENSLISSKTPINNTIEKPYDGTLVTSAFVDRENMATISISSDRYDNQRPSWTQVDVTKKAVYKAIPNQNYNKEVIKQAPVVVSSIITARPATYPVGPVKDCFGRYARENIRLPAVYPITLPTLPRSFHAYCALNDGYAWTLLQSRSATSSVSFWDRTFQEYAEGFGDPSGDHWLGLDRMFALQEAYGGGPLVMRIELIGDLCTGRVCSHSIGGLNRVRPEDASWWGEWLIKINSKDEAFLLDKALFLRGNLSNSDSDPFHQMNEGMRWSAKDADNDKREHGNCATTRQKFGGWWHKDCTMVALNGASNREGASNRMEHFVWHWKAANKISPGVIYNIKPRASRILLRPTAAKDNNKN